MKHEFRAVDRCAVQVLNAKNMHRTPRDRASIDGMIIAFIVMSSACAGPRYVRACNELAHNCSDLLGVCTQERAAHAMEKTQLELCNVENDRLLKMLAEPVPACSKAETHAGPFGVVLAIGLDASPVPTSGLPNNGSAK